MLQEGAGWVRRQDGSREEISAKSVVIYDAGDWVEYGSDSAGQFTIEDYWAEDLSEEEWAAILTAAFGPQAGS